MYIVCSTNQKKIISSIILVVLVVVVVVIGVGVICINSSGKIEKKEEMAFTLPFAAMERLAIRDINVIDYSSDEKKINEFAALCICQKWY